MYEDQQLKISYLKCQSSPSLKYQGFQIQQNIEGEAGKRPSSMGTCKLIWVYNKVEGLNIPFTCLGSLQSNPPNSDSLSYSMVTNTLCSAWLMWTSAPLQALVFRCVRHSRNLFLVVQQVFKTKSRHLLYLCGCANRANALFCRDLSLEKNVT